jgi:hypothetical protein
MRTLKQTQKNRKTKDGVRIKLFIIDVVAQNLLNSFLELSQRAFFRKYIISLFFSWLRQFNNQSLLVKEDRQYRNKLL